MKPFVVNRHGRLVFPSNFFPALDFSMFETLDQLETIIRRDFEAKAPTGSEILDRADRDAYASRHELLRDLALNLVWGNRYAMTMYEKRPTRWRDLPRTRDDIFLPLLTPWEEGERKIAAVDAAWRRLTPTWDPEAEERIFAILFDIFGHKRHHAAGLPPIKPTVAEITRDPRNLTFRLPGHDTDYPTYGFDEILDVSEATAELEWLSRLALVLHNEYPWDRACADLVEVGKLGDDDFVVAFVPRDQPVMEFIRRVKAGTPARPARPEPSPAEERHAPVQPFPPLVVREHFTLMPRFEALAVVKGEYVCTNEDVIRNTAYSWSPMTADQILTKTGIESRFYTARDLEDISLQAARAALEGAGRRADEIGAVIFCTSTTTQKGPAAAPWLCGELGIVQTHCAFDVVAGCAGFTYGIGDAVRHLQEVQRPVLLVCAEKFSHWLGNNRPARMLFGDAATAVVVGPAEAGAEPDVEVMQTFGGGTVNEVNAIVVPNPQVGDDITFYGARVKAFVERYLIQMLDEMRALPAPGGGPGSLLDAVDLVVPHQANRTMITELAVTFGVPVDQLYFNMATTGNVSAASIPLALHDAVRDGVIDRPMRVFSPAFGAGALGGYVVLRVDPAIVVAEQTAQMQ